MAAPEPGVVGEPAASRGLKIGCSPYDQVRALADGDVTIGDAEVRFESARPVTKLFERMIRGREFDVAEMGFTHYLRTLDQADPGLVALPIFLARGFRHGAIFINTTKGIRTPADLVGKRIGEFDLYGYGLWQKGLLSDEFGVTPEQCRWLVGEMDFPLPPTDFVAQPHPADVDVTWSPGTDLGALLEAGELDALLSSYPPRAFVTGSSNVARLFPDHEPLERDYVRRTGIFPLMHLIVVRRDLLAEQPGLATEIYEAFCASKEIAADGYRAGQIGGTIPMVPWLAELLAENRKLLGEDWWPYGVGANRATLDAGLRFHFEQGLSQRHLRCRDIFPPELLDT